MSLFHVWIFQMTPFGKSLKNLKTFEIGVINNVNNLKPLWTNKWGPWIFIFASVYWAIMSSEFSKIKDIFLNLNCLCSCVLEILSIIEAHWSFLTGISLSMNIFLNKSWNQACSRDYSNNSLVSKIEWKTSSFSTIAMSTCHMLQ